MEHGTAGRSRRALLRLASAGAGTGLICRASGQSGTDKPDGPLAEGVRFQTGGRAEEMVARARALGRDYEAKYGGCAQCTIAALQDSVDFVPVNEHVFLAGGCLSGGATQGGNANCGGFTGAGIVIGHLCGRPRGKFGDRGASRLASKLIREVAARYQEAYGSVLCKEVREKAGKNCPEVVSRAAGWAAEILLKQFSA